MPLSLFSTFILGNDFLIILLWWTYLFLVGLIFLPFTARIFKVFFDRGYLFSKAIGLLIPSYFVWLVSSLKILPFSRGTILLCIFSIGAIIFLNSSGFNELKLLLKEKQKIFVHEEAIFLFMLVFWAFIRGFNPVIDKYLEKFMDFGFVNSILRSNFMPPSDMWFAGKSINYYYFGHFFSSFLIKLTGTNPAIAFNIIQAVIFSFSFSFAFSIGANLTFFFMAQKLHTFPIYISGLISAVLLNFSSNIYCFFFAYLIPFLNKINIFLKQYQEYKLLVWNSARNFIEHTIYEFPAYTFVVADLHAHLLNIPFVLSLLAFLASYIMRPAEKLDAKKNQIQWETISLDSIIFGFFLAIFYMTNSWDFPIYFLVTSIAILYRNIISYDFCLRSILMTLIETAKILLLSFLFTLPFSLNFTVFAQGIGFVYEHTPLYKLSVIWGYQIFFLIIFIAFLISKASLNRKTKGFWLKAKGFINSLNKPDVFVLILCFSAAILIIVPEFVYIKDIYIEGWERANTMFKLVYQAHLMFDISIGYIIIRILLEKKGAIYRSVLGVLFFLPILMSLLWVFHGIGAFYGKSMSSKKWFGLDALILLRKINPDDFNAIQWLNKNVSGRGVALEASGDDFSNYGRISMATGLQTIINWPVHESLWRKGEENVEERCQEVKTIYESSDLESTKKLLRKYRVEYVVIGSLEKKQYKDLKEDKILSLGETVFKSPKTKIVKIR
ncbi:MAG: DUF2298 domain-containing protein [Candidatus Omnitrophica bacterium]|nr:DUF2298 domain-containing protein [Candidatus Omnitrophota bacterium]MDD5237718.1 DUF2298 domain-containing protein [Candidatus Omnitrophota bacterium]